MMFEILSLLEFAAGLLLHRQTAAAFAAWRKFAMHKALADNKVRGMLVSRMQTLVILPQPHRF